MQPPPPPIPHPRSPTVLLFVCCLLLFPWMGSCDVIGDRDPLLGTHASSALHPVVFLPGLMGSGLVARVTRDDYCTGRHNWRTVWANSQGLLTPECWMRTLSLDFDPQTGLFSPQEGVEVSTFGWGTFESIEYLDYLGNVSDVLM